jgi:hypothetical protein
MFDLNTFKETSKYFADQFTSYATPKDVKELTKKSQDFTLALIDANAEATLTAIQAFGEFAGSESTTYLLKVTEVVNQITENAKEIVQTGTFKAPSYAGYKK